MKDLVSHYWYLGLAFSAVYTFGSALWTLRVERKLRKLSQESRVTDLALEYVERDVHEIQRYLDKTPTGHFKSAVVVTRSVQ